MTVLATDAFVETVMGMEGRLVRRDVPLSAVALASYIEYGDSPWTEYSHRAMHNLADKNGWTLNLYSDEPEFHEDWTRFSNGINAAVNAIAQAIENINLGNF
jgi:hypothetical protein